MLRMCQVSPAVEPLNWRTVVTPEWLLIRQVEACHAAKLGVAAHRTRHTSVLSGKTRSRQDVLTGRVLLRNSPQDVILPEAVHFRRFACRFAAAAADGMRLNRLSSRICALEAQT